MQTLEFKASKVKCQGCVSNIKNGLSAMAGVAEVEVDIAGGRVTVKGDGLEQQAIVQKLAQLGYPVVE